MMNIRDIYPKFSRPTTSTPISRLRRTSSLLLLPFLLRMSPNLCHALIMAIHAINTLARLGKDKFIDTCFAHFTLEAMGMIRIISGHDGLV
jgi:hypothetical protein